MKIKCVGPSDSYDLPTGEVVRRGHQVDVSDELAGRPPEPRYFEVLDELRDAIHGRPDHERAASLRNEFDTLDSGDGLLALFEIYAPVAAKSALKSEVTK